MGCPGPGRGRVGPDGKQIDEALAAAYDENVKQRSMKDGLSNVDCGVQNKKYNEIRVVRERGVEL